MSRSLQQLLRSGHLFLRQGCPDLLLAASLIYVRRVSGFVDFNVSSGSVLAFPGPAQQAHMHGMMVATAAQQLSMLQYRDLGFEFYADDDSCVS